MLKCDISNTHQRHIYRESYDSKCVINLIVFLRLDNHDHKKAGQNVFKMKDGVNKEVPDTNEPLVPVSIYLVGVHRLIRDELMDLPTSELNLFLVQVFFDQVSFLLFRTNFCLTLSFFLVDWIVVDTVVGMRILVVILVVFLTSGLI